MLVNRPSSLFQKIRIEYHALTGTSERIHIPEGPGWNSGIGTPLNKPLGHKMDDIFHATAYFPAPFSPSKGPMHLHQISKLVNSTSPFEHGKGANLLHWLAPKL